MSLLWKVAAASGWWDARMRGDSAGMARHKDQVAKAHGVPGFRAGIGLRPIYQALSKNFSGHMNPEEAGYASGPKTNAEGNIDMPWSDEHPLNDHENWHHVPVTKVDISKPIHASQEGVGAALVAHNLFHPGKLPPSHFGPESEHLGNPDTDPDSFDRDTRAEGVNANEASRVPRFYRDKTGKTYVADGHHQVAAALLLKKPHIEGRLWDENNPPEGVK